MEKRFLHSNFSYVSISQWVCYIFFVCLICASNLFAANDDYSTWKYSGRLYLNTTNTGANVSGDVTDFPVLIRLTENNFPFGEAKLDGADFRVAKSDGTHLPYEIERWDYSSKLAEIWVGVDTVYGNNSSQYIVAYWGKGGAADSGNGNDVFDTSEEFVAVWHLGEDGNTTADGYKDATSNGFHGTGVSMTSSSDIEGMIGKAQDFDGTADYISKSYTASLNPANFTVSFWARVDGGASTWRTPVNSRNGGSVLGYNFYAENDNDWSVRVGNGTSWFKAEGSTVETSTWTHIAGTFDGTNLILYKNGSLVTTNSSGTLSANTTEDFVIGALSASNYFDGPVDEVQVLNDEKSVDWVKLSYQNQRTEDSLVSGDLRHEDYDQWAYSKTFFLNTTDAAANVSGDVNAFPLLIRLHGTNFTFSEALTGGADIRFQKSDGTHLKYEIERWDATNSLAEIWVKVDTVYGNNETQFIKMLWGKAGVSSYSNPEAVFETADSADAVWHLGEDGNTTAGGYLDATGNSYDGTGVGLSSSSDVTGIIGKGQELEGSPDEITMTNYKGITGSASRTSSIWIQLQSSNNDLFSWGTTANGARWVMKQTSSGTLALQASSGNVHSTFDFLDGNWHHVAAVLVDDGSPNANEIILYIDGVVAPISSSASEPINTSNTQDVRIGVGTDNNHVDGYVDEARIAYTARSADYIKLSYMNQRQGDLLVVEDMSEWTHSRAILLNTETSGGGITSTLTDFPTVIKLHTGNFDFSQAQGSGQDIRFRESNGDVMAYEIERWDSTNALAEIWVRIPTVTGNSTTEYITMHWGNINAQDLSYDQHVFETSNNFQGVWHLGEDGSTTSDAYDDATGNENDGTGVSMTSSSDVTGIIGKGQDFDGTADYITVADDNTLDITSAITISAWAKVDATPGDDWAGIVDKIGRWTTGYGLSVSSGDHMGFIGYTNTSGWLGDGAIDSDITSNTDWNHWVCTYDGTDAKFYQNGSLVGTSTISGETITTNSNALLMGLEGDDYIDGSIDEGRVSSTARSADWIKLSYMNQKSIPQFADAEDYGDWTHSANIDINTTASGANVSGNVADFPFLLRFTSDNFTFSEALDGGTDLRFAGSGGEHLAFEVERWDSTNAVGEVWVKLHSVLGSNNTQYIKMYWGNTNAVARSDGGTVFNKDDNFGGVWHLAENGNTTSDGYADASNNGYPGTGSGLTTSSDVSGIVGLGSDFDGTDDFISFGHITSMYDEDYFTVSMWFNRDVDNGVVSTHNLENVMFATGSASYNDNFEIGTNGSRILWYIDSEDNDDSGSVEGNISDDTWHYLNLVYDKDNANEITIYLDGSSIGTSSAWGSKLDTSSSPAGIGIGRPGSTNNGDFDGILDEVRLSTTARSADWINLAYENQKTTQVAWNLKDDLTDWTYSRNMFLNTQSSGAHVANNVINFPILIRLKDESFDFTQAQGSGQDIRFSKSNGDQLDYEVERWDSTNAVAEIWVLVDTVYGDNSSQYITMYWGNNSAVSRSNGEAVFSTANSFVGVWHMGEASGNIIDATANGFDGTASSSPTYAQTGTVGQAITLDGVDDYFTLSDLDLFTSSSSDKVSLSAWVKTSSTANYDGVLHLATSAGMYLCSDGGFSIQSSGDNSASCTLSTMNDGTWHYLHTSYNEGTEYLVYLNGQLIHTEATADTEGDNSDVALIGNRVGLTQYFDGTIDEVRGSNVIRSADWIKLSYENQKSNQTLVEVEDYNTWNHKTDIYINTTASGANTSSNVLAFPYLVRLDSFNFNFSQAQSNGEDIRFSKSDGVPITYEIERWDADNEVAEIWVKLDTVYSDNSSQYFSMYWGKATAADHQNPENVFSATDNFAGVWHLEEDGNTTSDGYVDATGNNNHGTGVSMTASSDVAGAVGKGHSFDGSADYIDIDGYKGITGTADRTITAWVKHTANDGEFVSWGDNAVGNKWIFRAQDDNGTTGAIRTEVNNGYNVGSTDIRDGEWHHVASVLTDDGSANSTEIKLYVDGALETSSASQSQSINTASSQDVHIGLGHGNLYYDGTMDEVRVSSDDRSADWIKLSYHNQRPDDFTTNIVDDLEEWPNSTNLYLNTQSTGADVSGNVLNFPVLIRLTSSNFKFDEAMADGADIRFSKSNGDALAYEIERWDNINEVAEIWVKADTVYGDNATQFIKMYWGRPNSISRSNPEAVFTRELYYKGVYHLGEDGNTTSGGYLDATNKSRDLTGTSMTSESDIEGIIGKGQSFDGTADYLEAGDINYFGRLNDFSVSFWGYKIGGGGITPVGKINTSLEGWEARMTSGEKIRFTLSTTNSSNQIQVTGDSVYNLNNWYLFTLTYDGSSNASGVKLYIDKTQIADTDNTDNLTSTSNSGQNFRIGARSNGIDFEGYLDEVRIHTNVLSADWIKLSYENQKVSQSLVVFEENYIQDWTYKQDLTLNTSPSGANVTGDVNDFPLLVRLTSENFDFSQAQGSGEDLRFSKSDGTPLFYEIERWDSTNAAAEVWIRVDTVYATNNSQYISMYWGNSSASSKSNANAVFDISKNWLAVYHLEEDGNTTASGYKDATDNEEHGTGTSMTTSSDVDGIIGRAQDFDGANDYISTPSITTTSKITISAWANIDNTTGTQQIWNQDATNKAVVEMASSNWRGRMYYPTTSVGDISGSSLSTDTWTYVTYTYDYDNNGAVLYVDGSSVGTATAPNDISSSGIGAIGIHSGLSSNEFDGTIDEVRVSKEIKSADWVKLSYENQKLNQTLVNFSSPATAYAKATRFLFNTTGTGAGVGGDVESIPILVRIDSSHIDFSVAKSDGSDILFTDSSGAMLYHEVVLWDKGNDTALVWVKVPKVDGNSNDDYIDLHYGCANCTNDFDKADSVWNGFKGVWHLNGGEASAEDKSSAGNDGTYSGSLPFIDGITTLSAPYFDGTDDYITVGTSLHNDLQGDGTLSTWIKTSQTGNATAWNAPGLTGTEAFGNSNDIFWGYLDDNGKIALQAGGGTAAKSTSAVNDDTWKYISLTRDESSGEVKVYVNGTLNDTQTSETGNKSTSFTSIGRIDDNGGTPHYYMGYINEFHITDQIRSADYIKLSYENQKLGSTFLSAATINGPVAVPGLIFWVKSDSGITKNAANLVTKWEDISGGNHDMEQLNTGNAPKFISNTIGGKPIIRFDGADDYLIRNGAFGLTGSPGLTFIAVVEAHDKDKDNRIFSFGKEDNSGGNAIAFGARPAFRFSNGNRVFNEDIHGEYNIGTWVWPAGSTYENAKFYRNGLLGTQLSKTNGSNSLNITGSSMKTVIGGGLYSTGIPYNPFDGDLAEILLFDRELSELERLKVEQYLRDRYFLTPKVLTTLTATTNSDGDVGLNWTLPVSSSPMADTIGIWAKLNGYPDSSRNGILVGYFPTTDTSYTWDVDYPGVWHFTLLVRDTNDNWSNTTDNAQDTASVFGNAGVKLTFNTTSSGADITEDQINFPMLVRLVAADSGIFNACPNADGTHLRFIDDDGVTDLDFEVERWDNSSDLAEIWVRVPRVDGNSSTDFITMEYRGCNNPDASNSENVFRTADNFQAVMHLNEDGNTDTDGYKDATSNDNHGTGYSMTSSSDITGEIGIAQDFVGSSSDYIEQSSDVSLDFTSAGTISAWVKFGTQVSSNNFRIWARDHATSNWSLDPHQLAIHQNEESKVIVGNGSSSQETEYATNYGANWHHLVGTFTTTSSKLYFDGAEVTSENHSITPTTVANVAGIGKGGSTYFTGGIDELQLSNTNRSADWIKLSYETQKSGSSVITQTMIQRIYVDSALGSDNYTCIEAENPSTPKRTITSAVACDKHDAADTVRVLVQPGTYTDSVIQNGDHHVMIQAADLNNMPILNGRFDGTNDRTVKLKDKTHIRNFIVKPSVDGDDGIRIQTGDDNISIIGCQIINNGALNHNDGVFIPNTGATSILIANNIIHNTDGDGIEIESNNDVNILHNVIYNPSGNGIKVTSTGADDISITNNIIYNATTGISESDADDDIGLISNNLFYNVTTQVSGGDVDDSPVTTDPLFISTTFGQEGYMKLSANSPAIDAGTNSLDPNTSFSTHAATDLWGTNRPVGSARDIGVYEGSGESQTFTGEFDTLTVVESGSDTVGVHTSGWAIIFRKTEGGGIADLRDKDAWATNLLGSDPLFEVNLNGTTASSVTNNAPTIVSKNRVQAVVRQKQPLTANFDLEVLYTIYPSGHIYVQSKITNTSGSSQSNQTLDYLFEVSSEDAGFQNGGNSDGYGYLTTSTRDVYMGITDALNLPNGLTWDGNFSAANNNVVWDTDDIDFVAGDEFEHHFLIYIGDESLTGDKSATIYNDTYYPQKLDVITGTPFGSEAWELSLVGQWNFDEGAGSTARDISGNARNGTITTATYTTGKSQTALDFTTSDYVTVSHHGDFNAGADRSFMAWIKKSSTFSGSESDARFISKGSDIVLGRSSSANQVIFTAGGTTLTDGDAAPNDEWFHIAGTIDVGNVIRLYVNGVLREVSSSSVTIAANTSDLIIGKNGVNTGFDGEIDDVRIYHTALNTEELQTIYNEGLSHGRGAYRGRASNNNRFVGILNQTSDVGRFQPVFLIDNWYGGDVPQYVYVDGVQLSHYTDFISVEEPHPAGGNTLMLQINKTLTGTDIDIFIDDNDSSGYLGASSVMPTLHTSVTASDKISVKNLSGTTFGNVGSKQWEFEIDLDGSTGTTDGDGGIHSWKSSEISPNTAISSATDLTGSDSVTLDQMKFDNVALSGASWTSPDPNTYTIDDSSTTRLKITMGATTINGGTPDVVDSRTYTFYPTGKIFVSHSITSISAQPTTPQLIIERLNSIAASSDATSGSTPQDSARGGKLTDSNINGSFHGFGVSVLSVKSNGSTVSGQTAVTGNSNASDAFALNFNNTYFESADATITVNYMIDFTQNYDAAASLDSALQDVQNITSLTAVTGSIVTNDVMDFDTDGFAEGEGVWTYSASSGVAEFKLNATQARFHPAFKISSWNSSSLPQIVLVNNQEQVKGYHYNATVDGTNNALIIQFNKVFTGATNHILISQNASLAVTLSHLSAIGGEGVDTVKWTTESELDNLGFYILRREKPKDSILVKKFADSLNLNLDSMSLSASDLVKLDTSWRRLNRNLIPGPKGGRSSSTRNYTFIDRNVKYEVEYEYILVSVDINNIEDFFGPVEAMPTYPNKTRLYGNYPNPFNPMTIIRFDLRATTKLSLKIYDVRGHLIRTLITPNKPLKPGQYRYTWDAKDDFGKEVPSGHYIYMFVTPKYKKARKMTLIK